MKQLFPRILGNEQAKNRIGAAILSARAPHAFLIVGEDGSGKHTLALNIAAALNCERRRDAHSPLPCCACGSCQRIFSGGHVDVRVLDRSKDRATLGVSEVKELREDMFLSSTEADVKVYIISDAEKLTTEAQNALLIVLEEPPENVVIMLLATSADSILTTIKSRAQLVSLSRFSHGELREHLLKLSPEARALAGTNPSALDAVITAADGRLGRALELSNPILSAEEAERRELTLKFLSATAPGVPYVRISEATSALPTKRAELLSMLEAIIQALRDLTAAKKTREFTTLFFPTPEEARRFAEPFKPARLIAIYELVSRAHEDCTRNANVTLTLTNLASGIRLLKV